MVPQAPSDNGRETGKADNRDRRYSILVDASKAADKYCNSANMLDDHHRISYQRPKVVRAQFRIALKMIQKGFGISVVVRI